MDNTALTSTSTSPAPAEFDPETLQRVADRMGLAWFDPNQMRGLRELGQAVCATDPKLLNLGVLTFSQQDLIKCARELDDVITTAEKSGDKLMAYRVKVSVHEALKNNVMEARELAESIKKDQVKPPSERGGECFRPGQKLVGVQINVNAAPKDELIPTVHVSSGSQDGTGSDGNPAA